jgi:hypothetical protein
MSMSGELDKHIAGIHLSSMYFPPPGEISNQLLLAQQKLFRDLMARRDVRKSQERVRRLEYFPHLLCETIVDDIFAQLHSEFSETVQEWCSKIIHMEEFAIAPDKDLLICIIARRFVDAINSILGGGYSHDTALARRVEFTVQKLLQ